MDQLARGFLIVLFVAMPLQLAAGEVGVDDFRISFMGTDGSGVESGDNPKVAYNPIDDEYLVVWSGRDATEFEIWAQLVDGSTGALITGNFKISDMGSVAGTTYTARDPDVVFNATSQEYLVVWWGDDDTGSLADNEWEIFGQRLSSAGAQIGGDFRISSLGTDGDTNYVADAPISVAWDSVNNRYLVVYGGRDPSLGSTEQEIFGRLLDSTGASISADDVRLSTVGPAGDTARFAFDPDVAFDPNNQRYLVVWAGEPDTDNAFDIYGQLVTAGGAESGSDFRISDMGNTDTDTNFRADHASVAFNASANEYLVVWRGDDEVTGDDVIEIFSQRVTAAGVPTGTNDVKLSDMGPAGDGNFAGIDPEVAFSPSENEWLVVWQGDETVNNDTEIWAQRVSATGNPIGVDDHQLSSMGPAGSNEYWALEAAVAWGDGRYLVIWRADDDTGDLVNDEWEVYGQFLTVPSAAQSIITADPDVINADGVSTSSIHVQLRDSAGTDMNESGGTVVLATTRGTLGVVTDHGDGTCTATLTSSTSAGTATITGTLDTKAMTDTAAVVFGIGTPANLAATAINTTQVSLTWTAVGGATSYDIYRATAIPGYGFVASSPTPAYTDSGRTANTTYLYIVRAVGDSGTSPFTPPDAATTIIFTDPTLSSAIVVKAVHLTQLRTAVNAMRAAAALSPASFTGTITAGSTLIAAAHITELRSALDTARTAIGLPPIAYTDPALGAGTGVKGAHFTQLRQGTQ